MNLPKFLMGDNTDFPDDIFIIHTEYPRFIINLANEEVEWLEDVSHEKEEELKEESERLFEQAAKFYDREVAVYEESL